MSTEKSFDRRLGNKFEEIYKKVEKRQRWKTKDENVRQ